MFGYLERFPIEMAFICACEDKAGKKQKRSQSGLRQVFVTQPADMHQADGRQINRKML